jgi:MarR family transcriptional regulator, transcriptional regulator for hemolysin
MDAADDLDSVLERAADQSDGAGEIDFAAVFSVPGATAAETQDLRLGFLMHDVSRLRRMAFDQLMKPLGVTRSQWWVIAHLSRHDGMMQTELASLLDIGKVTLGGLVDRLEAGGLVVRRLDGVDRRVRRIFLTENAHRLIRDMQVAEREHNTHILKDFSPAERTLLTDLLVRLKRNLREGLET